MAMAEEKKRTIKLFCPSISKLVPIVAWEDQRLDLGSIARTFGIEPATLKLNGHFISRGVDLIASSVTWKSLISFFSSRGFSTGVSDSDALIVDGKLAKSGSKRGADSPVEDEIHRAKGFSSEEITHPESTNSIGSKRIKEGTPGTFDYVNLISRVNSSRLKRKLGLEGISQAKRTRTNEPNSDQTKRNLVFSTARDRQPPCSLISHEMKRMREDNYGGRVPFEEDKKLKISRLH